MKRSVVFAATAGAVVSLAALTGAPAQAGMTSLPAAGAAAEGANASLIEKVGRRGHHRGYRRGAAIGAGIVTLGVLGAIAASKAHERRYYRRDYYGYGGQCRRWRRWCYEGNDRACWKFDSRC